MVEQCHVIAIKEKRAVGARKKLGFGGTWSILEQVKGRGPGRGRGGGVGWGGVSERWGFRAILQEFLGI